MPTTDRRRDKLIENVIGKMACPDLNQAEVAFYIMWNFHRYLVEVITRELVSKPPNARLFIHVSFLKDSSNN